MATGLLKKVGVEAVVEGLSKFMGDVDQMNKKMGTLGGSGNIVSRAFDTAGNALKYFGDKLIDIATYAIGQLLARAIEFLIGKLAELVSAAFEAASQFQALELRLNRLNFNSIIESVGDYNKATAQAVKLTKEQLDWILKLAVTTPYDAADVANVFTLARSYGFAADAAQGLTEDITNFAAGMGLGNTEIERIIVNFGQMVQQGKVTQREMNDLARGAFVPVNDVLKLMQEQTGLTGAEFDKFIKTEEGVKAFFTAFSTLVDTRFTGASQDMARTFKGATDNAKDFISVMLGLNVLKPILDAIGGAIADFMEALTRGNTWERFMTTFSNLGNALAGIVTGIIGALGGGLSIDGMIDKILVAVSKLTIWLHAHKGDIIDFFLSLKNAIALLITGDFKGGIFGLQEDSPFIIALLRARDLILGIWNAVLMLITGDFKGGIFGLQEDDPFILTLLKIRETVIAVFTQISDWITNHGALLKDFFTALGSIIGQVFQNLVPGESTDILGTILGLVEKFMTFVIENQEGIAKFITVLTQLWVVFSVVAFVLGIVVTAIGALAGFVLSVIAVFTGLVTVIIAIFNPIGILITLLLVLGAQIVLFGDEAAAGFQYALSAVVSFITGLIDGLLQIAQQIAVWVETVVGSFILLGQRVVATVQAMIESVQTKWKDMIKRAKQAGVDIITGLVEGVKSGIGFLVDALVKAVLAALKAVEAALGIGSPSKVFAEVGMFSMQGLAKGILDGAKLAEKAMETAVGALSAPALALPAITQQLAVAASPMVNNSTSITNNMNLNINSQTPKESLVQDYNMLVSLIGA